MQGGILFRAGWNFLKSVRVTSHLLERLEYNTIFVNKFDFAQAHCGTKPPFCRGRRTAAFRSQTSRRKKTFQVDELHRNRSPNQAAADAPPVAAAAAHVALASLPTRRAIVFQP